MFTYSVETSTSIWLAPPTLLPVIGNIDIGKDMLQTYQNIHRLRRNVSTGMPPDVANGEQPQVIMPPFTMGCNLVVHHLATSCNTGHLPLFWPLVLLLHLLVQLPRTSAYRHQHHLSKPKERGSFHGTPWSGRSFTYRICHVKRWLPTS